MLRPDFARTTVLRLREPARDRTNANPCNSYLPPVTGTHRLKPILGWFTVPDTALYCSSYALLKADFPFGYGSRSRPSHIPRHAVIVLATPGIIARISLYYRKQIFGGLLSFN